MQITHFTELRVYQCAFDLAGRLFVLSKTWPPEERFALTSQLRRAARSVGANIAEAWGKRRYEAHFVSKLTDADSENHEVEHWLLTAQHDGYLSQEDFADLLSKKQEVGKMLGAMMHQPGPFLVRT